MLPLRIATYLGFVFSAIGAIGAIYLVIKKIIHPTVIAGYTSNMVMLLVIGGIIMIILGIIGEFIGRIYMTVSGMPQYCIRQVVNVKEEK